MSFFGVTLEIVDQVKQAQNSDRLDLVTLENKGFQFITQRGLYEAGDVVVYFPVDSLLSMWIVDALGLTGKLAHGAIPEDDSERLRNRVKTVKLRGNISQGVVCKPQDLIDANKYLDPKIFKQDDVTLDLGVTKFEPPVKPTKEGILKPLPDMVIKYDIEGAQNFPNMVNMMLNEVVWITEKLEGSNWWASIDNYGEIIVGQRNYAIEEIEDKQHDWYKAYRKQGYEHMLTYLLDFFNKRAGQPPVKRVTIRGEMLGPGVQGNYYQLKDHEVYLFEIEVNGKPIDANLFGEIYTHVDMLMSGVDIKVVPTLSKGQTLKEWLDGRTIVEASDGKSILNENKRREGIVIKPVREMLTENLERVFIKQRGPVYLSKSDL